MPHCFLYNNCALYGVAPRSAGFDQWAPSLAMAARFDWPTIGQSPIDSVSVQRPRPRSTFFRGIFAFSGHSNFLIAKHHLDWVLLGFTGFYRVLLGFTWFYWVLLGFTVFFPRFTGFHWVLLGFIGLLPSITGYHWVLLGFTKFYWVLLGFYRVF